MRYMENNLKEYRANKRKFKIDRDKRKYDRPRHRVEYEDKDKGSFKNWDREDEVDYTE